MPGLEDSHGNIKLARQLATAGFTFVSLTIKQTDQDFTTKFIDIDTATLHHNALLDL